MKLNSKIIYLVIFQKLDMILKAFRYYYGRKNYFT